MPNAIVTPNGPWGHATSARVEYENTIYPNLPIVCVPCIPTTLSIHRAEYPGGLVILCDIDPPSNSNEITLPVIISAEDTVEINLPMDCVWPCCCVILWA
jgi:hypothetical protein